MTIALGLIARGGVVLASDTQESAGYWKRSRGKLSAAFRQSQSGRGHAYITSWSGSTAHCQGLAAELRTAFDKAGAEHTSAQALKPIFAEAVQRFFVASLAPFSVYPAQERPEASMLVAHDDRHHTSLWAIHDNMLLDVPAYHALGIGADMALNILARYYRLPEMDVRRTIMLAAYVMAQVKDSFEGCGKATDLFFIKQHGLGYLSRSRTEALEEAMRSYAGYVEPAGLRNVLGVRWEEGTEHVNRARASVRRLLPRVLTDVGNEDE